MTFQIVPQQAYKPAETSLVWLALYANFIQFDERTLFGLYFDGQQYSGCDKVFTKPLRDTLSFYLGEAQREIENFIGYFAWPQWVSEDNDDDFYRDNNVRIVNNLVKARWGYVIQGGIKAVSTIRANAAISYVADPATIGPINLAGLYPASQIHVFFPGTDIEIPVSGITVTPGTPPTVTITVPRARLVQVDAQNNPMQGWNWATVPPAADTPFETVVDVKRIYNDPSTHAHLVNTCGCGNSSCGCTETTDDACIKILDARLGELRLEKATYNNGWRRSSSGNCCSYDQVRLNYRAGLRSLDKRMIDMIIRLAHAKMPWSPCDCEYLNLLWERDRANPDALTPEREGCPFGINNGAWAAWQYANSIANKAGRSMGRALVK